MIEASEISIRERRAAARHTPRAAMPTAIDVMLASTPASIAYVLLSAGVLVEKTVQSAASAFTKGLGAGCAAL